MPFPGKPTCTLLFILSLSLLTLFTTLHHHRRRRPSAAVKHSNILYYRNAFLSSSSNRTIAAYLRDLTSHPHLAGTPPSLSTAAYVQFHFHSLGLPTHMTNFSALLSYPTHSSLTAHLSNATALPVPLAEPNLAGSGVVPPYHAYSPSGAAHGAAVFLNYGREEDYRALAALGVQVEGCVGLVRRGSEMSRYEAVANAAAHGVAAVVMYTESEYKEGVERGTVMKGLGDPLTPGWAAVDGGERLGPNDPWVAEKFPAVPSMPVSEAAAESILATLEGAKAPYEWRESLKNGGARRIRRVGPGPTMLNFSYEGERKTASIHNVFAVIKGTEEPDRAVLLGNHRDAWTYGAVDPNSGTAALLDIARRLSLLMRLGWNPRRTIVLCSWDAEEFGMIGSTEWVEQNIMNLGAKAVAYFNVDCAAQGPGLFVSATPQLDDLLVEATKQVKDPDSENAYFHERWTVTTKGANIERLSRADSDFAPFLQHAGVPSVDLYFGSDFPVYHTAFDSYDWMRNFGDPLFKRHVTVAGIWGYVALCLADDPILPYNYFPYANELQEYKNTIEALLEGTISLDPIAAAIKEFTLAANKTGEEIKKMWLDNNLDESTVLRRRMLNDRLLLAERGFLDSDGLPGRQWFKHLIYGPRGNSESKIDFFPGIAYEMSKRGKEEERRVMIQHEIWRVARAIQRAASALRGEFS